MSNPIYVSVEIPEEQARLIEQIQQRYAGEEVGFLQGVEIVLDQTGANQFYDVKFHENARLVIVDQSARQMEQSEVLEKQIKSGDVYVNLVKKEQHVQFESVTNKIRKAIRVVE